MTNFENNHSERLKEIRNDLGSDGKSLSQQKLADSLGMSIGSINSIESGHQKFFSLPLAYAIHKKYGYELMWIFYGKGQKFPIKKNTMEPRSISLKAEMKNWGKRLVQIQIKSGLSDEQFAKVIDIKYKRFLDLCTKSSLPSMDEVLSICENADVTIDFLLFGDTDDVEEKSKNKSIVDKLGLTPEQIAELKKEFQNN